MLPGTKGLNVAKAGTLREPANRFLILLMPIFFFFFYMVTGTRRIRRKSVTIPEKKKGADRNARNTSEVEHQNLDQANKYKPIFFFFLTGEKAW